MEKFIFSADLHGNISQYNKLFAYAIKTKTDIIIIGGDITPKNPELRTPQLQKEFLTNILFPLIKDFKTKSQAKVLIIMGNDDFKSNHQLMLDKQNSIGFKMIDAEIYISQQGFYYVGYSYVPYTPFKFKDWEKRDLNNHKDISARADALEAGVISQADKLVAYNIKDSMMDSSIEDDLKIITKNIPTDKMILVTHAPPYNTACDYTARKNNKAHVGSKAVRKFIEETQPLVTLHGHIHDTVELSKKFPDHIGNTLCASVGNDHIPPSLYIVEGNIAKDISLKRILVE